MQAPKPVVAIVEKDQVLREQIASILIARGIEVKEFASEDEVNSLEDQSGIDAYVIGEGLGAQEDSIVVASAIREARPEPGIILLASALTPSLLNQSNAIGATQLVILPLNNSLALVVAAALERMRLFKAKMDAETRVGNYYREIQRLEGVNLENKELGRRLAEYENGGTSAPPPQ